MRVPMNWLNEYCDSGMEIAELAERLAMTGTEVERIARHGAASGEGFVVGKVLTREKHPDADKLSVC
jgi:phenylalanyl-tRNA synthetase beta chain